MTRLKQAVIDTVWLVLAAFVIGFGLVWHLVNKVAGKVGANF